MCEDSSKLHLRPHTLGILQPCGVREPCARHQFTYNVSALCDTLRKHLLAVCVCIICRNRITASAYVGVVLASPAATPVDGDNM